jgi:hypothetical protein
LAESGELRFVGELVNDKRIDFLMRIFDNCYLVISEKKFAVKAITAEGFRSPVDGPVDQLNKFEAYLNAHVNLDSRKFLFNNTNCGYFMMKFNLKKIRCPK